MEKKLQLGKHNQKSPHERKPVCVDRVLKSLQNNNYNILKSIIHQIKFK